MSEGYRHFQLSFASGPGEHPLDALIRGVQAEMDQCQEWLDIAVRDYDYALAKLHDRKEAYARVKETLAALVRAKDPKGS